MSGTETEDGAKSTSIAFLTAIFPQSDPTTLASLLAAAGDDPALVVAQLVGQEAADHQAVPAEEEHPLDVLQGFYPNFSPKLIQAAWIRCNGDVTLAAEHLLNPTEDIPLTAKILPPKSERGGPNDVVLQVRKKNESSKPHFSTKNTSSVLDDLAAVFPDQPLDLLNQVLRESNNDLEQAALKVSQWTMDDCRKETGIISQSRRDLESLQVFFASR
jgi:hypothetical protein